MEPKSKPRYAGVSRDRLGGYKAYVSVARQNVHAGRWLTPELAALARDRLVLQHGLPRSLNFPKRARKLGPASAHALRRQARLLARGASARGPHYLGVTRVARTKRWLAYVQIERREVAVGAFDDARLAAEVRDRVTLYAHRRDPLRRGDLLNFPARRLLPMTPEAARAFARKLRKESTSSRHHGVSRDPRKPLGRPWIMRAIEGKEVRYRTERAAAIAYDRAALYYFGGRARLNFPQLAATLEPASITTLRAEAYRETKASTSSRFVGLALSNVGRWTATVRHDKRIHYLGTFETEEDAARAYDAAARRLKGNRLRLNFHPVTGEELCGEWFEVERSERSRASRRRGR